MSNKILFSGLIIVGLFMTVSMIQLKLNSCKSRSFDGVCCQGSFSDVGEKSRGICNCDQYCLDGDELRPDCCPDYRDWCRPRKDADPSCKILSNNGTCCLSGNSRCYIYSADRSKRCHCDDSCIRENDCCKDYKEFCQTPGAIGYFNKENNLENILKSLQNKTVGHKTNKTNTN